MKGKLIILISALLAFCFMAMPAVAQTVPGSAYLTGSDGRGIMSSVITCNGTGTDTSDIFYFKDIVPYGAFWIKFSHKDTLGDSIYYPKLYYKFVNKDGKFVASDSVGSWVTLLANDSTKIAITVKDTIYWRKTYDFRAAPPAGIVFKGTGCVAHDSSRATIEVTGAEIKKNYGIILY